MANLRFADLKVSQDSVVIKKLWGLRVKFSPMILPIQKNIHHISPNAFHTKKTLHHLPKQFLNLEVLFAVHQYAFAEKEMVRKKGK